MRKRTPGRRNDSPTVTQPGSGKARIQAQGVLPQSLGDCIPKDEEAEGTYMKMWTQHGLVAKTQIQPTMWES